MALKSDATLTKCCRHPDRAVRNKRSMDRGREGGEVEGQPQPHVKCGADIWTAPSPFLLFHSVNDIPHNTCSLTVSLYLPCNLCPAHSFVICLSLLLLHLPASCQFCLVYFLTFRFFSICPPVCLQFWFLLNCQCDCLIDVNIEAASVWIRRGVTMHSFVSWKKDHVLSANEGTVLGEIVWIGWLGMLRRVLAGMSSLCLSSCNSANGKLCW